METASTSPFENSPKSQAGVWSVGAKGGLYTGLIIIIFSLISYLAGIYQDNILASIVLIISFIIGIYLTHKAFKEQGNGYMTYAQGLGPGTVLGLVSGVLSGIFLFFYLSFIDNSVIDQQKEQARIQLENQGMTDAQIDQAMQITELMMTPAAMFFLAILSYLFYAFIISLIISAFTKKTDPQLKF